MTHRGPDGAGIKIFKEHGLGLAHRRLSILDISEAGTQPMADRDASIWITYNGEIFNFIEIRDELKGLGYSFVSDSDTEVIISAYKKWGTDCFYKFNGMWAICIWDSRIDELILCRDRYGIKPLYYHHSHELFAFASETNAFKHLDGLQREVDPTRLQIGLADTYALEGAGHTLFKNIFQLQPGHMLRMKRGGVANESRWYDIRTHIVPTSSAYDKQVEDYKNLFADCCALRMRSDVTLATALSGGVDSTAVYSMVHHLMNSQSDATRVPDDWQQAFVQTFPGTEIDERAWAEKAVSHTNGSATYLVPDNKSLADDVLKTNVHFDAISTTPIIALMGVYKGMRDNGVTVSLDGHGVDEMLFGYKKLVHEAHQYHTWNASENEAKKIAEVLASLFPEEQRERKLKGYCKEIDLAQAKRNSLMGKIKKVYRNLSPRSEAILVSDLLPTRSAETYEFGEYNALDQAVLTDFFQGSLPSLLRNFDKAAMYSSIEIRMPFMDYRLVEKSFSLPVSSKLGGGYTKRILRDAMAGIMPEANRVRTYKVGLGAPTGRWMHKELKELVTDTLNSKSFKESNLFEGGETLDLFNDIETASDPRNIEVWKHLNAHWISS